MRFERCHEAAGIPARFELSGAGDVAATVVPTAGMNLVSLAVAERPLLRLPLPLADFMTRPKTGGVPLLHPWANRLRGDRYGFEGTEVDLGSIDGLKRDGEGLPMHGLLLRFEDWQLSSGVAAGEAWVEGVVEWADHPALMTGFPFPHRLRIRWTIRSKPSGVEATCLHAIEADAVDVPAASGWHPYLAPGGSHETLRLETPSLRPVSLDATGLPRRDASGGLVRQDETDLSGPLAGRSFDDLFEMSGEGWTAAVVAADGARLEVIADRNWRWMQVYAPEDSDFACIEPMLAPTAGLSDGDVAIVAAGTTLEASFTIRFTA
ncbi:MAG: aldose 1-epimerase [Phycisphaerales bacterium]|nr:aldose 1-epimerase [Phycisphaerales bacterium]MDG2132879.1 aldose 1-epimerase [Phycisphaerales bacterium]